MKIIADYKNLTFSDFQKLFLQKTVIYENEEGKRRKKLSLFFLILTSLITIIYWSGLWIYVTVKHISYSPFGPFQDWERSLIWLNSLNSWHFTLTLILIIAPILVLLVVYLFLCFLFIIFKIKVSKYKRTITLSEKTIKIHPENQKLAKDFLNIVFTAISKTDKWIKILFKAGRVFYVIIPNTKESLSFIQSLIKSLHKKQKM